MTADLSSLLLTGLGNPKAIGVSLRTAVLNQFVPGSARYVQGEILKTIRLDLCQVSKTRNTDSVLRLLRCVKSAAGVALGKLLPPPLNQSMPHRGDA